MDSGQGPSRVFIMHIPTALTRGPAFVPRFPACSALLRHPRAHWLSAISLGQRRSIPRSLFKRTSPKASPSLGRDASMRTDRFERLYRWIASSTRPESTHKNLRRAFPKGPGVCKPAVQKRAVESRCGHQSGPAWAPIANVGFQNANGPVREGIRPGTPGQSAIPAYLAGWRQPAGQAGAMNPKLRSDVKKLFQRRSGAARTRGFSQSAGGSAMMEQQTRSCNRPLP